MNRWLAVLALIFVLMLSVTVWAKAVPTAERIEEIIRRYIIEREPDWRQAQVVLEFKGLEAVAADVDKYGPNSNLKVNYDRVPKLTSKLVFPLLVEVEGIPKTVVYVQTRIRVNKSVVVTRQKIKKRTRITTRDVERKMQEISNLPANYFAAEKDLIGKEATTSLPPGTIILPWMVQAETVVKRGDTVRILFKGQGLELMGEGKALQDGFVGKKIRVQSLMFKSKKEMDGVVVGTGEVKVEI